MSELIEAFTDGSAVVKGKCECNLSICPKCNFWGGYGVYMKFEDGSEKCYSRGFKNTKTGRMEVMAVLSAIKRTPKNKNVILRVYSDSAYVVNSIQKGWVYKWQNARFFNVKSKDLWEEMLWELKQRPKMTIVMQHIKGHQENLDDPLVFGNNVADRLADYKRHKKRYKDNWLELEK